MPKALTSADSVLGIALQERLMPNAPRPTDPPTPPSLVDDEERAIRSQVIKMVVGWLQDDGHEVDARIQMLFDLYIAGELDKPELKRAVRLAPRLSASCRARNAPRRQRAVNR